MFGIDYDYKIYTSKLRWFEPVILQWLRVNRNYMENWDCTDTLYWYNERTNVSALAGAVWQCGGFALEEFSATKGKGKDESKGRIDLSIQFAEKEIICEAKQKWPYLCQNQRTDFQANINSTHEKAIKDTLRTQQAYEAEYALALSFFPTYTTDDDVKVSLETLHNSLSTYQKTTLKQTKHDYDYPCTFFAWLENNSGKDVISGNGNICNAVGLLGTLVN